MSRSGYDDYDCDYDQWGNIRWRGMVASATRGKRGQAFLRELLEALDAMPVKRLIREELRAGGEVCTLGAIGERKGVNLEDIDPEDHETLGAAFNIATPLVQEIEWLNDDAASWKETPEERWARMRRWVVQSLSDLSSNGSP